MARLWARPCAKISILAEHGSVIEGRGKAGGEE
jgi:hypothetical protein